MSKRKAEEMTDDIDDGSYSSLLRTGKYSDLTIKCKDRTFQVHKAIVCPRSKPFDAMVDSEFREGKTGIITLTDEEPEIFEKVIDFMYTTNYSDTSPEAADAETTAILPQLLLTNTKVYVCAEMWNIPKLKTLALVKFETHLHNEGVTASFCASLELLFDRTPKEDRELKDVAIKYAASNYHKLVKLSEFVKLCRDDGKIAFEVLEAASIQHPLTKQCPGVGNQCNSGRCYYRSDPGVGKKAGKFLYYCIVCHHAFD